MSASTSSTLRRRVPAWSWLQKFGSPILVAAIAFGGYYVSHYWLPGSDHAETEGANEDPAAEATTTFHLPEAKRTAGGIRTQTVERREYRPRKRLPGTVVYDATGKVEVRATTDTLVLKVLVESGQRVAEGDPLLRLTAAEVGESRIACERAATRAAIAEQERDWASQTDENLQYLLSLLDSEPAVGQLEQALTGKPLGTHRDQVLTAYSEYQLARKTLDRSSDAGTQGVLAGKVLDERRSRMEIATARFRGMIEESQFQSMRDLAVAESELAAARKELRVCEERLAALMGPPNQFLATGETHSPDARLNEFVLVAPRDGTVVDLQATESARFSPGEVLLVLADTRQVWVEAQLPQGEVSQFELEPGDPVEVLLPGVAASTRPGRVRFFRASVSTATMAVPLVAELENRDGRLRPGMFVWVRVPFGSSREGIVVPVGAVQRAGTETFVFVDEGKGDYRKIDVQLGRELEDGIEIEEGLEAGAQVVVEGAFFLKSEMLLEAE